MLTVFYDSECWWYLRCRCSCIRYRFRYMNYWRLQLSIELIWLCRNADIWSSLYWMHFIRFWLRMWYVLCRRGTYTDYISVCKSDTTFLYRYRIVIRLRRSVSFRIFISRSKFDLSMRRVNLVLQIIFCFFNNAVCLHVFLHYMSMMLWCILLTEKQTILA